MVEKFNDKKFIAIWEAAWGNNHELLHDNDYWEKY
jgi:hypothetical protein